MAQKSAGHAFVQNIDQSRGPIKSARYVRRWLLPACIVAVALGVGILFLLFSSGPEPEVIWLNEAPFTHPLPTGPLPKLQTSEKRLFAPLLQWLQLNPTTIEIHSKLLACSAGTIENLQSAGFPSALATNSDGVRVWVLSSQAATLLWTTLESSGAYLLSDGHVIGSDGVRRRIYGGRATSTLTNGMPTVRSIDFVPKVVRSPVFSKDTVLPQLISVLESD